jgi:hypothetical protein
MAIAYRPTEEKQLVVESKPGIGPFVFHQMPTAQNLPLHIQRLLYGRWSCAVQRSKPALGDAATEMSSKNDELIEPSTKLLGALGSILPLPKSSSPPTSKSDATEIQWKEEMDFDLSASYGYVLHRANSDAKVAVASNRLPKLLPNSSQFLKRVPNLSRVMPHLGRQPNAEGQEVLSFKLLPSLAKIEMSGTIKVFNRVDLFPEIYVDFIVKNEPDSGGSAQLHQVYAKVEQRFLDAMLPACATDVRFRKTVIAQADVQSIERSQAMKDFIQQARSHCMGYDSLQSPSPVKITLPKRILQQKNGNRIRNGVPDSDSTDVHYMFASVEKRFTIPFVFGEHNVSYVGVDAGKIGGSWQELLLHMPKSIWADNDLAARTTGHADFTRATFALASRIDLTAKDRIQPPQSKKLLETNISIPSATGDTVAAQKDDLEHRGSSDETMEARLQLA